MLLDVQEDGFVGQDMVVLDLDERDAALLADAFLDGITLLVVLELLIAPVYLREICVMRGSLELEREV